MEHTKGELEYSVLAGTKTPATLFIKHNGDELDIAVFEKWETDWAKEEMEANAKELARRWNAFEKDGLVDELRKTLTSTLHGEFPLLLGLAKIEDAATGSSINTINVEGRIQEVEAAIAKCS